MIKNYFYIFLLAFFFTNSDLYSQDIKSKNLDFTIEGLTIYPNPVSNGKLYITSKLSLNKEISIFNVLGKEVLRYNLTTKELNIATLSPGIYIIQIKEGEATATRKLIIK